MNIQLTTPYNEFWSFIGRFGKKWKIEVVGTHHNPIQFWLNADEEYRVGIAPSEYQCKKIAAALEDGRISVANLESLQNQEYDQDRFRALEIPGGNPRKAGRSPMGRRAVRLDLAPETDDALKAEAARRGVSKNTLADELLRDALQAV